MMHYTPCVHAGMQAAVPETVVVRIAGFVPLHWRHGPYDKIPYPLSLPDRICSTHLKIYSTFLSRSAQPRQQSHQTMSAQLYLIWGMGNGQVTKPM